MKKTLPIYQIAITDSIDGMTAISLVDRPAVETDFLCFRAEHPVLHMKVQDSVKHCITGVAILADTPIYRINPDGYEYAVVFTKDCIRQLVEKYSQDGLFNKVNLQHDHEQEIDSALMVEFYIKDVKNGIDPVNFKEAADGSLFVTYKINDEALWDEIINGDTLNGFSIEVTAGLVPTPENAVIDGFSSDKEDDFDAWLDEVFKKKSVDLTSMVRSGKIWTVNAEGSTMNIQCLEVAKIDGRNYLVAYSHGDKEGWKVLDPRDIESAVETDRNARDWSELKKQPAYTAIGRILDDAIVKETALLPATSIHDYIHQRRWVMIRYDDEREDPHTGSRQCMVVAHGYTKRGNECLRVYERYGDSRSVAEGHGRIPDYRLVLTKRINDIRVLDYMQPWGPENLDGRYNWNGDNGMGSVMDWYGKESEDRQ